jgi:hypothetical protein
MTQHCPSKADFTAEGVATVSGSCPSAKTTALKPGMTLKNREVLYRHTLLKIPTIF